MLKKLMFAVFLSKKELLDIQFQYFRRAIKPKPNLGEVVFYEYKQFKNVIQCSKNAALVCSHVSRSDLNTRPVIILFFNLVAYIL